MNSEGRHGSHRSRAFYLRNHFDHREVCGLPFAEDDIVAIWAARKLKWACRCSEGGTSISAAKLLDGAPHVFLELVGASTLNGPFFARL